MENAMSPQSHLTRLTDWRLQLLAGAFFALYFLLVSPPTVRAEDPLSDDEVTEIAIEAYLYAYPLVIMDVTRQISTNCEVVDGAKMRAPVNQFAHVPTFPDASFTDVVRANVDTLYSALWFDVNREPLIIHVPDSGGRYYLLPILDLWTDVFSSPGKRTTGTAEQTFAIVSPKWQGELPDGVRMVRAPTGTGWMVGRTQTNGKSDYDSVHEFQASLKAIPLSAWGKDYTPPKGQVNPMVSSAPPTEQVAKMDAATFFARFTELTKDSPPHPNDNPVLARMKRIGLQPGEPFDFANASPQVQKAMKDAVAIAQEKISSGLSKVGIVVNGWGMMMPPIGTYGTDYLRRAQIAYGGLGANVIEDAIYPTAFTDADGKPFDSSKRYVLHFAKDELPPVRAFWSLTMYNDKQAFADNPLNRYALGDRDKLKFGEDGSLTLYIQRESPGKDRESNWLPAPKSGGFSMNMRLYWPKPEALDGSWHPPAVQTSPAKESTSGEARPQPGQSLGIQSVPNLRDVGGYVTSDGRTVVAGLAYRANQLSEISPDDMQKLSDLGLKNAYDLRTLAEREARPEELPSGVSYVWLDVLADAEESGAANLERLMKNPKQANEVLGDGKAEAAFMRGYRDFVSLSSARLEFRKLFLCLGDKNQLPAVFHCTTGKDRTGWATAALLTLLGVPREKVMEDFLRSNEYIIPKYKPVIDGFVEAGGDKAIPAAILGVKQEYLEAAFDEMETKYGTIENYFSEGLGISTARQQALRDLYLN